MSRIARLTGMGSGWRQASWARLFHTYPTLAFLGFGLATFGYSQWSYSPFHVHPRETTGLYFTTSLFVVLFVWTRGLREDAKGNQPPEDSQEILRIIAVHPVSYGLVSLFHISLVDFSLVHISISLTYVSVIGVSAVAGMLTSGVPTVLVPAVAMAISYDQEKWDETWDEMFQDTIYDELLHSPHA